MLRAAVERSSLADPHDRAAAHTLLDPGAFVPQCQMRTQKCVSWARTTLKAAPYTNPPTFPSSAQPEPLCHRFHRYHRNHPQLIIRQEVMKSNRKVGKCSRPCVLEVAELRRMSAEARGAHPRKPVAEMVSAQLAAMLAVAPPTQSAEGTDLDALPAELLGVWGTFQVGW